VKKVDTGMATSLRGLTAVVAALQETADQLADEKQAHRPNARPTTARVGVGK
jgi:outer membrane murein-binding lipoprotein Lpp